MATYYLQGIEAGDECGENSSYTTRVDERANSKTTAEKLLEDFETDQTKQLQRFVLLKQVKVLTLQQERLELMRTEVVKDVAFDYVGFKEDGNSINIALQICYFNLSFFKNLNSNFPMNLVKVIQLLMTVNN